MLIIISNFTEAYKISINLEPYQSSQACWDVVISDAAEQQSCPKINAQSLLPWEQRLLEIPIKDYPHPPTSLR